MLFIVFFQLLFFDRFVWVNFNEIGFFVQVDRFLIRFCLCLRDLIVFCMEKLFLISVSMVWVVMYFEVFVINIDCIFLFGFVFNFL